MTMNPDPWARYCAERRRNNRIACVVIGIVVLTLCAACWVCAAFLL